MTMTRRETLTVTLASSLAAAASSAEADVAAGHETVEDLISRSEKANAALMRGDIATYRDLIDLTEDFVLMSPFGGPPSRGGALTPASWEQIGRFFRNGSLRQELVQAYAVSDMVVLAVIEHGHGEVGGLQAQDWPLRVTLVFRRDGTQWRLAHRHADPLVRAITLEQSAALARSGGVGTSE